MDGMTEQEARTRPLSEVWEEFGKIAKRVEFRNDRHVNFTEENQQRNILLMELCNQLRPVLLERCKRVEDSDGYYTEFHICEGILDSWFCKPSGERSAAKRQDTPETARNMAAAYSFMAWELEQRKEVKGE